MSVKQELDTKISISVKKDTGVTHKAHIWFCGKMTQEEINKIDNSVYYKVMINTFFGENTYEITEVLYTPSKKSDEDYNTIIVDESDVKDEKVDTKVIIKVKRVDFNGNHIIKNIHIWFPSRKPKTDIDTIIFGYDIRNRIRNYFGSTDYELVDVKYEKNILNEEFFGTYIDQHLTIKRENIKKESINLEEMNLTELLNLKDRVEEIIFKKENNFTDEEYEIFLENEEFIKKEDVKKMFDIYKKDKFVFKKMKIKQKIKDLYEVNQ